MPHSETPGKGEVRGRILNIQRMSTEDGPGIRTTVFFKGCPLSCAWCHNPESIDHAPRVVWHDWLCMGCGTCVETCPHDALEALPGGIVRRDCRCCGGCVEACPTGAMQSLGDHRGVEQVLAELLKDRAYYENSRGGVTLSGGEPSMQPRFASALMSRCRSEGIHVALDTCGHCKQEVLLDLSAGADLVLFDIKLMESHLHRQFTGRSNRLILDNLLAVAEHVRSHPACRLWIRTPLIPGATATDPNLLAIGRFIQAHLSDVVGRWELCAFNRLCTRQYQRLGLEWSYADVPLLTGEELEHFHRSARSVLSDPNLVVPVGATG